MAPDLDVPNMEKPFRLYVSERVGTALDVRTNGGAHITACISTSKTIQRQGIQQRGPAWLEAVAATTLMVKEASKVTLGQPTTVYTPHQVQAVFGD